uniref:Uncharacterized protein n=1 Tax=Cannabis sativa TaxID=3483 RepID=A0A803QUR7_CANSA
MVRVIGLGFLSFLLSQPTTTNHSYPENNLENLTPQTLRTEPRNFLAKLVATTHYRVVWVKDFFIIIFYFVCIYRKLI